ncbi:MAG: AAA family ATPase [Syntrophaceae bacterium]
MSDRQSRCPGCLTAMDPGDRFCRHCGAALETRPQEHRYVTVLFSDLSGYTALSEQLDPEDLKEIMDRIFAQAARIIARYDGMIEKFIGDAVVALFGVLRIHEDDVIRAIQAAREIHAFVGGTTLPAAAERRLDMHTGIHAGNILAGSPLSSTSHGALGTPINIAARLSTLAGPGEILIGEAALFEAERHFKLECLGDKTLKGVKEPVRVYKVIAKRDMPHFIRRMKGPAVNLIGRRHELAMLQDSVAGLCRGRSSVIWLKGEAGVGKSRLIHELAQLLPPHVAWHVSPCLEYAKHVPYFPIQGLVNRLTGGRAQAGGREPQSPEEFRRRMYENLRALIEASSSPVVLCIEDAQWADESSMDILKALFKPEQMPARCLILVSSREDKPPDLAGSTLELPELSYPEVSQMVGCMLESASREMLARLYRETGGNPLYVEEMVYYLLDTGSATLGPAPLPGTLKGLICARFDRLGAKTKHILQQAAVIGFSFTAPVLKAIDPELTPSHLQELRQAGFILSQDADTYVFRHAVSREAAYESLLKHERSLLHGRIGRVLEGLSGEDAPDILAAHFCRGHDYRKAVRYSLLAAERGRETGAWVEAAVHYTNAEQALQRLPDDEQTAATKVTIWEGLWTCTRIFNPEQAVVALKNLVRVHEAMGDKRAEVFARIRLINLYTQKAQFSDALATFKTVLPLTEDDARMRAAAETTIAYAFTYRGVPDLALTYLTAARSRIDPDDLFLNGVNSLMTLTAFVWKGDIDQALFWYQNTCEFCRGQKDLELLANLWLGYINHLAGNFARGAVLFERVAASEQMLGAMSGALPYVRTQSSIYFNTSYLGRPQAARRDLQSFSRWCDSMQVQGALALLELYEGWIALAEDRLEKARLHLEQALPALKTGIANRVPYALNALSEVLLRSRFLADAQETALNGVIWNREHGNQEQLTCSLRLLGEALIAIGDLDRAKPYLAEADHTARIGCFKPHLAWTYEAYARYWEKRGNESLAQDWNRKAYAAWTAMGNLFQARKLTEPTGKVSDCA